MPIALWLFVVFHSVAFGAGLYEHRIVLPLWFEPTRVNSEAMRRIDTGRAFWGFVSTGPLTLLMLINGWFARDSRWLALSVGITAVERLFTFGFFIPNAIKLMKADTAMTNEQALAKARQWRALNRFRLVLSLAAYLTALEALTATV